MEIRLVISRMICGKNQLRQRLAGHKGVRAHHVGLVLKRKLLVLRFFFPVFLRMLFPLRTVMLGKKGQEVVSELLLMVAGVLDQLVKPCEVGNGNMHALQEQQ